MISTWLLRDGLIRALSSSTSCDNDDFLIFALNSATTSIAFRDFL